MKLYFVRHGESEANLHREFSNRGHKHGLTDSGREQARTLASRLPGIDLIYTSPLLRAIETSEILSQAWNLSYEITDALREFDCGVLEGRSDQESWQRYDQLMKDWFEQKQWDRCIEGGERFTDIQARFLPFIDQLVKAHGSTPTNIVLVGHGGTYHCMLPLILQDITFEYALHHGISNTGYVRAELHDGQLECSDWQS